MFDIGFWEIFLILLLALLVIGPERLPGAARSVGHWVGKARRYIEGVKSEVEQEFDVTEFRKILSDQENKISELKQQLSTTVTTDDLLNSDANQNNDEVPVANKNDSTSASKD